MTREEAITVLKGLSDNPLFSNQHRAAFNIAIHDIKARYDWDINNLILINKDNYEPLEQEPKTGEWIEQNDDYFDWYECSECGYGSEGEMQYSSEYDVRTNYCPNCGAKMESEDKE